MTRATAPTSNDDKLTCTSWHKSSYSGGNNNCVELATLSNGRQAIRDSKDARGPVLAFDRDSWGAFIESLK